MSSAEIIAEFQDTIAGRESIHATAGRTKSALRGGAAAAELRLERLAGIIEYEPSEYTFTAFAGTPVREVRDLLARHGQYMPFDPPLGQAGATLGGTVAAGLSGPGRLQYGGIRDFLLGVRLIDGQGKLVYGGGRVVKNAAGFDIPKLMVGSLGCFGVMVELTFKVFPRKEASATIVLPMPTTVDAVDAMQRLAASALDLTAIELQPPSTLLLRITGLAAALDARLRRVQEFLSREGRVVRGEEEDGLWAQAGEFAWLPPGHNLVKAPITSDTIAALEAELAPFDASRRYGCGGKVAWIGWPETAPLGELDAILKALNRPGLVVTGICRSPFLGAELKNPFYDRLLSVFDPLRKFERVSGQHSDDDLC